jgi:indolepyruvate ferredoxin oxidoreductase alpha subunit
VLDDLQLPNRPPQLCEGCPHDHAYKALKQALVGLDGSMVTSDIGCYTLGALAPLEMIDSCVCMGASIGMARGAAEAGAHPVVAVIGDSTFLHSGITPLLEAAAADTPMTLLILDNQTVGMTGAQDTMVSSSRLQELVLGLGVSREHFHVVDPHPRKVEANAGVLRREIEHRGLSVVVAVRECKVAAKRRVRAEAAAAAKAGAAGSAAAAKAGAAGAAAAPAAANEEVAR